MYLTEIPSAQCVSLQRDVFGRHGFERLDKVPMAAMAMVGWRKQKTPVVHGGDTYVYAVYVSNISTAYLL